MPAGNMAKAKIKQQARQLCTSRRIEMYKMIVKKSKMAALILMVLMIAAAFTSVACAKSSSGSDIRLNKTRVTLKAGKTVRLKLKGAKARKVKWKSSKKSVVVVNKKGKVTAIKKGKAKIIAKYKGKKYICKIKVKASKKPAASASVIDAGGDDVDDATVPDGDAGKSADDATVPDGDAGKTNGDAAQMTLTIDGKKLEVEWLDNDSVKALKDLTKDKPLVIKMEKYGGFEQVGSIGKSITRNDKETTTSPGDIVLYSGNQIVIFYGSNSWSYTRLGHINMSKSQLKTLLGGSDVTCTIGR